MKVKLKAQFNCHNINLINKFVDFQIQTKTSALCHTKIYDTLWNDNFRQKIEFPDFFIQTFIKCIIILQV